MAGSLTLGSHKLEPAANQPNPGAKRRRQRKRRDERERRSPASNRRPSRSGDNLNGADGVSPPPQTIERNRGRENAEAGPGPTTSAHRTARAAAEPDPTNHNFGDDFVAFELEEEAEGEEKEEREKRNTAGERQNDHSLRGRKRKEPDRGLDDRHSKTAHREDVKSREAPWLELMDIKDWPDVSSLLHSEVDAFIKYISPTPEEDEVRTLTVEMISRAVTKSFPDARVLPFGSFETKLYLPMGDIDLVVISKSMEYSDRESVLRALANTLRRAGITDKVTVIAKAKVPIIKFVTAHGRFAVDISINQANGIQAGAMVLGFLRSIPAIRALVLVTKAFLAQRSMNEVFSGGLGSYSIVCLAISFLQMHPKVRRGEIDPMKNLGVLVMEFFELYGCYFNYQEVGISIRDGGTYFSKQARGWVNHKHQGLLCIEDPGDISNDVSKGSFNIARVRQTFAGAHHILTARAYMQANIMKQQRAGRAVSLRGGRTDPQDVSMLSHILSVTRETINRRTLIKELYGKQTLHRILGVAPRASVVLDDQLRDTGIRVRDDKDQDATKRASSSVQAAWKGANESDDELYKARRVSPPSKATHDEEPEESRYEIPGPPKKRRRLVGVATEDHPIVFTSADEGSEHSLEVEEREYISLSDEEDDEREQGRAQRRAYWAAKAAVGRGAEGTESE